MFRKIHVTPALLLALAVVVLALSVLVISVRAEDPLKVLPTVEKVLVNAVPVVPKAQPQK